MKFNAWYRMKYNFFLKSRFEGILSPIIPLSIETEDWGSSGGTIIITQYSKANAIQDVIRGIPADEIVSYSFELNDGVLLERLSFHGSIRRPSIIMKSVLNPLSQDLFLRHIFKFFGVYLAVFIKCHQFALTGQEYILNEYKDMLEKHSSYTTGCGDYTFLRNQSEDSLKDWMGVEAELEQNTSIALDTRKGITLVLYRDLKDKDQFIVDEQSVNAFGNLSKNDVQLCSWAMVPLQKENVPYDLLYSFMSDYPETVGFVNY